MKCHLRHSLGYFRLASGELMNGPLRRRKWFASIVFLREGMIPVMFLSLARLGVCCIHAGHWLDAAN